MESVEITFFEGLLRKKSRGRSLFHFNNWKERWFRLEGQDLTYYKQDKTTKISSINTKGCTVSKLSKEDADGEEFAFVLDTDCTNNEMGESLAFAAVNSSERTKWMSYITASSSSRTWFAKKRTVARKTGQEITIALLAQKRANNTEREETATLVLESLRSGYKGDQYKQEVKQLERCLEIVDEDDTHNEDDKEIQREKFEKTLELTRKNQAAFRLQTFCRNGIAAKRKYLRMYFAQSVLLVQTRVRMYFAAKKMTRLRLEKKALAILSHVVMAYTAKMRALKKTWDTGNIFSIKVKSAAGMISPKSTSSNMFVYTMSCYDQSNIFKGKNETKVKNGYGLKTTSLHKGLEMPFSHDPEWVDEFDAPSLTANTTKNCFLVLTVMTKDSYGEEGFLGQCVVQIDDKDKDVHGVKLHERLYAGECVEFKDYPLKSYVAPVENDQGVASVVLNVALQVRAITGKITFTVQLQESLKSFTISMEKESTSFFNAFASESKWKTRLFILGERSLFYAVDIGSLESEDKHRLHLDKVISMKVEFEPHENRSPKGIILTYKMKKNSKEETWKLRFISSTFITVRQQIVRKLYRSMPNVNDPNLLM